MRLPKFCVTLIMGPYSGISIQCERFEEHQTDAGGLTIVLKDAVLIDIDQTEADFQEGHIRPTRFTSLPRGPGHRLPLPLALGLLYDFLVSYMQPDLLIPVTFAAKMELPTQLVAGVTDWYTLNDAASFGITNRLFELADEPCPFYCVNEPFSDHYYHLRVREADHGNHTRG